MSEATLRKGRTEWTMSKDSSNIQLVTFNVNAASGPNKEFLHSKKFSVVHILPSWKTKNIPIFSPAKRRIPAGSKDSRRFANLNWEWGTRHWHVSREVSGFQFDRPAEVGASTWWLPYWAHVFSDSFICICIKPQRIHYVLDITSFCNSLIKIPS